MVWSGTMCVFLSLSRHIIKKPMPSILKCPVELSAVCRMRINFDFNVHTYVKSGSSDYKNKLFSLASNLVESRE